MSSAGSLNLATGAPCLGEDLQGAQPGQTRRITGLEDEPRTGGVGVDPHFGMQVGHPFPKTLGGAGCSMSDVQDHRAGRSLIENLSASLKVNRNRRKARAKARRPPRKRGAPVQRQEDNRGL